MCMQTCTPTYISYIQARFQFFKITIFYSPQETSGSRQSASAAVKTEEKDDIIVCPPHPSHALPVVW